MNRADILAHEVRHALAGCMGFILLDPAGQKTYSHTTLLIDAQSNSGECAFQFPDFYPEDRIKGISSLMAFGPIARNSVKDTIDLVRKGTEPDLIAAGNLSPQDVRLCRSWDGPPLLPLRVIAAVTLAEKALEPAGWSALTQAVASSINQHVDLTLAEILPWNAGVKFLGEAQSTIEKTLSSGLFPRSQAERSVYFQSKRVSAQ